MTMTRLIIAVSTLALVGVGAKVSSIRGLTTSSIGAPSNNTVVLPCNNHGQLLADACYCYDGFVGTECETRQKQQVSAILAGSAFGLFGGYYFYLGYTALGAIQAALFVLFSCIRGVVTAWTEKVTHSASESEGRTVVGCVGCMVMFALATFAWWLAVIIMALMNTMSDSDGYELVPWQ